MNRLLLDIGNTRLKWRSLIGDEEKTGEGRLLEEVSAAFLRQLLAESLCDKLYVSNVSGPEIEGLLNEVCDSMGWPQPVYVRSEAVAFGITNAYSHPERLGVDRWLAMIAASEIVKGAFSLVDAGSAVTIDHVDAGGRHLGGVIAPGYANMLSALLRETSLNISEQAKPENPGLENDTGRAIRSGCATSLVALVEYYVHEESNLVLTGGDAQWLQSQLKRESELVPDLVFKGLARYAEEEM